MLSPIPIKVSPRIDRWIGTFPPQFRKIPLTFLYKCCGADREGLMKRVAIACSAVVIAIVCAAPQKLSAGYGVGFAAGLNGGRARAACVGIVAISPGPVYSPEPAPVYVPTYYW